jgi:hypothetical protein
MNVNQAVSTQAEVQKTARPALRPSRLQDPLLSNQVTNSATVIFV